MHNAISQPSPVMKLIFFTVLPFSLGIIYARHYVQIAKMHPGNCLRMCLSLEIYVRKLTLVKIYIDNTGQPAQKAQTACATLGIQRNKTANRAQRAKPASTNMR